MFDSRCRVIKNSILLLWDFPSKTNSFLVRCCSLLCMTVWNVCHCRKFSILVNEIICNSQIYNSSFSKKTTFHDFLVSYTLIIYSYSQGLVYLGCAIVDSFRVFLSTDTISSILTSVLWLPKYLNTLLPYHMDTVFVRRALTKTKSTINNSITCL